MKPAGKNPAGERNQVEKYPAAEGKQAGIKTGWDSNQQV